MRKKKCMQKNRIKKMLQCILVMVCLVVPCVAVMPAKESKAAGNTEKRYKVEIHDFDDFFIFANDSQRFDYANTTVKLNENLDLTAAHVRDMLKKYNVKHLTIGTKDRPFKGTFDGQNHYIKGLVYDPGIIKDANSGLFSFIEGATIKNLTVQNASIESIYQGGIIVGHAQDSTLENLTVVNSRMKINSANDVLSLITNLGFCGGGIAGVMRNSTMYNCEISGTEVVNNHTAGITGVGGEGLYMGGLVGWAENSTIEYSRVRSNYLEEQGVPGGEIKQSKIRNEYDIAVGALGGKSVYAGGIVGGVNTTDGGTTKIVDCFSTADVSFYAANYVAVGSGVAGYAGGITGALRGNSHIERCHYAGNIHSKQYNAILVIPIIQTDVNISGLSHINSDASKVEDSFFKRSCSTTKKTLKAVGTRADIATASAEDDETYANIDFWESHGYDFIGNVERNSEYSQSHFNKWVMDYDLGIPVHGSSVYAIFDFPGAGTVSIDKTALVNKSVSTSDPFQFATQGTHPRGDHQVNLTVTPTDSNKEDQIDEYRFDGWFLKEGVEQDYVTDIADLEKITHAEGETVQSKEPNFTVEYNDNQIDRRLYVACLKARVAFHEVEGAELGNGVDYYTYRQTLPNLVPNNIPEGSTFYGWTTVPKKDENGKNMGYEAIDSVTLTDLINRGEVYKAGDPVLKTMELYPIFTSYITNVKTIFEGHETDNQDNVTLREGVGSTSIGSDEQGVYIEVKGDIQNQDGTSAFPDGYQFLGWYEQVGEGDHVVQTRVSDQMKYYVPDTSKEVTYIARFLYRVDCFVNTKDRTDASGNYNYWKFYSDWVEYDHNVDTDYLTGLAPVDHNHKLQHWSADPHDKGECSDLSDAITKENPLIIKGPVAVYGHWSGSGSHNITVYSDFPNAAQLSVTGGNGIGIDYLTLQATPYIGYKFVCWAEIHQTSLYTKRYCSDKLEWKDKKRDNLGVYRTEAHLAAKITFHDKVDKTTNYQEPSEDKAIYRRYQDHVFQNSENTYTYYYKDIDGTNSGTAVNIDGNNITLKRNPSPSDDDMQVRTTEGALDPHYEFLGWIKARDPNSHEKEGIVKDSKEWNELYDVQGDQYCTTNADKAKSYLLSKDAIVGETMDLYPVYVKYDIQTTTNIHEMNPLPNGVNYPAKPNYTLESKESGDGTSDQPAIAKVTVTANTATDPVKAGEDTKYELVGMRCIQGNTVTDLWAEGTPSQDGKTYTFTMNVEAGKTYLFQAIYNPAFVVYHVDSKNTQFETKNVGQQLGNLAKVNYDSLDETLKNSYMIGWTEKKPENENHWYHLVLSKDEMEKSGIELVTTKTVVQHSMELWPVFCGISANVNSNIDEVINKNSQKPENYRFITGKENVFSLTAKDYPGYAFQGWYTGYQSDAGKGTEVSNEKEYVLKPTELFTNTTYTAVYSEAIDINYHDFDGTVIYSAKATKADNRTFVTAVEKPGTTEKVEVPIDTEAFMLIEEKVQEMATTKKTNMRFVEWRLEEIKEDGSINYTHWSEFKNKTITQSVDLYPVAYEVGFYVPTDKTGPEKDTVYDGMIYSVSQSKDGKHIDALFTKDYTHPQIKITTKEITWEKSTNTSNGDQVIRGLEGIHTDVHMSGVPDKDGNPTYIRASEGTVTTDQDGVAIHNLYGNLVIKKEYPEGFITNGTVIMNVEKLNDNDEATSEIVTVPVVIKDGKGQLQIRMPLGKYRVTEDMKWMWRDTLRSIKVDDQPVSQEFVQTGAANVTINVLQSKIVVFGNERTNQKWFSDYCENKNVFGKETNPGGTVK